jgi:hypothetical protein
MRGAAGGARKLITVSLRSLHFGNVRICPEEGGSGAVTGAPKIAAHLLPVLNKIAHQRILTISAGI